MSKKIQYVIEGMKPVNTLKEVSEILGVTVTKKEIIEGRVEGVTVFDADATEEGTEITEEDKKEPTVIDFPIEENVEKMEQTEETTEEVKNETKKKVAVTESALATKEDIQDDELASKVDAILNNPEEEEDTEDPTIEELQQAEDEALEQANEEANEEANEALEQANEEESNSEEENYKIDPNSELGQKLAKITKKKTANKTPKIEVNPERDGYPEKGQFSDIKELKKYYKQLTDEQLDEWLELEGLEVKLCDNDGINRMRKCMKISDLHFPREKKSKKKSKYAQYTTIDLLQLCLDNNIEISDGKGDERILRMYAIVALRKAGVIE